MRALVVLMPMLILVQSITSAPLIGATENERLDQDPIVFATTAPLGPAAVSATLQAAGHTTCSYELQAAGRTNETFGADSILFLVEPPGGHPRWFHLVDGDADHLHIEGAVDTRESRSGGWISITISSGFSFIGALVVTIAGTHLHPWPAATNEGRTAPAFGEQSLRMTFDCDEAPDITLHGSREISLLNAYNAQTGTGAHGRVGSVTFDGRSGGEFTAPEVRFRSGSSGNQAGTLTVTGPEVEKTWTLTPSASTLFGTEGGPGTWEANVDRAAGVRDAYWSLLAGFHPIDGLDDIADLPEWS